MRLYPLLLSLSRSPLAPLLLIVQVALSVFAIAHLSYLIFSCLQSVLQRSGMDEKNVFWVQNVGLGGKYNQLATIKADLDRLSQIAGVVAVAATSSRPMTSGTLRSAVSNAREGGKSLQSVVYQATPQFVSAYGLTLVQGHMFDLAALPGSSGKEGERLFGDQVVITSTLAEKLFGSASKALGRQIYFGIDDELSATVIGIVDLMQAAPYRGPGWEFVFDVVIAPAIPSGNSCFYIVRTRSGARDAVMTRLDDYFEKSQPDRYIGTIQALDETVTSAHESQRNDAEILVVLALLVSVVTLGGLFGFATYRVSTRTGEIGIRRAIGATKRNIFAQFVLENWLIVAAGLITGTTCAAAFGVPLAAWLQGPRTPFSFIVCSAVGVWAASTAAIVRPCLRASRVSPATATKGT